MIFGCAVLILSFAVVLLLGLFSPICGTEVNHPVYPIAKIEGSLSRLEQAVAPLMALTEDEMVSRIPEHTGFRFMGCPNCDGGTQEGQLRWSIADPKRVRCHFCEMIFPNETYPENRVMTVTNPVGKSVDYPFWEDATGYRYLFSAKAWREARVYFSSRAQDLGELYQLTGEGQYARRAALILDTFARYYPGFLVSEDLPHRPKGFALSPPYPSMGGKWGRWRHDEMPTDLVYAYDSIYDSGALEALTQASGEDVKARVEQDLFHGAIRQDRFHEKDYSNAAPRIYEGYAVIGRVLGEPGLVHEAVRMSRTLFERKFYEDGFWLEGSVGYHLMTMRGMAQVFKVLKGYQDPPNYVDPADGTRYDRIDPERDIAIVARARRILEICRYPDGRSLPVHDNWARYDNLLVPEKSTSTLLAGMGHAWLARGAGEAQTQLHLHFSGGYGHEHADNLSLALFSKGHEVLPDLGYTHTRHRAWSTSSLCHNLVVIDEKRQYTRGGEAPSDGRLLAFETTSDEVQWVEAEAGAAYPGLADVYRRGLMLIQAGSSDVYAVDLFWVQGGAQHDWVLHGSADADGSVEVNVPLKPYGDHMLPDVSVRYPKGESDPGDAQGRNISYAFFQHVDQGQIDTDLVATFRLDQSPVGVRTHLPQQNGA
ncbi:MAG: heparinase II/III family protein, partial [bacterium]|nr:heparinase II/III family protein [bacterium]